MNNPIEILKRYRTRIVKFGQIFLRRIKQQKQHSALNNNQLPLTIFYRISDAGYRKEKPAYINNENCLRNAIKHFSPNETNWFVIADNCSKNTLDMIRNYLPENSIHKVSVGNGAGTFKIALEMALKLDPDTPVYFVENDYLHRKEAQKILLEGLNLSPYITLYDHPDKYDNNHFKVVMGGEKTRVIISQSVHWKFTHSTTMTFASTVKTLLKDKKIFDRWTQTAHPYDCEIFIDLARKKRYLISPIPAYSTHGETKFLALFNRWEDEVE
jgi:hypothetical protein